MEFWQILLVTFGGLVAGLLYAFPLGPVGLIVFQTSMWNGLRSGLIAALGAAIADLFLGTFCWVGLTTLFKQFPWAEIILLIVGGAILMVMGGILLYRAIMHIHSESFPVNDMEPPPQAAWWQGKLPRHPRVGRAFIITFVLTITSPVSWVFFTIATTQVNKILFLQDQVREYAFGLPMILGITVGSFISAAAAAWLAYRGNHLLTSKLERIIQFGMSGLFITYSALIVYEMIGKLTTYLA